MTKRKTDRRVEKTERALCDALFALMIEQGFERTTVADIAERANVGRSTFYAHYADKEALLRESLRGLRRYLVGAAAQSYPREERVHPALAFSLPMLEHLLEVKDLFGAVAGQPSGAPVQRQLQEMLVELVRERLEESKAPLPGPPELVAEFVVGAFLSVSFWWMANGAELPAKRVDAMFRALVGRGLR